MESEASQVVFMEGGTDFQCLVSDNRVTPSELSAETAYKKQDKKISHMVKMMECIASAVKTRKGLTFGKHRCNGKSTLLCSDSCLKHHSLLSVNK